jgi:hypothetical protein
MADFLTRLAERTLGMVPVVQPVIDSLFAPGPTMDSTMPEAESWSPVDEMNATLTPTSTAAIKNSASSSVAPTRDATTFRNVPQHSSEEQNRQIQDDRGEGRDDLGREPLWSPVEGLYRQDEPAQNSDIHPSATQALPPHVTSTPAPADISPASAASEEQYQDIPQNGLEVKNELEGGRGGPSDESGGTPWTTHRGGEQHPPHTIPPQTEMTQTFQAPVTSTPAPTGAFPLVSKEQYQDTLQDGLEVENELEGSRDERIRRAATFEVAQAKATASGACVTSKVVALRDDALGPRSPQKLDGFPEDNGQKDSRGGPGEKLDGDPGATHLIEMQSLPGAVSPQCERPQGLPPLQDSSPIGVFPEENKLESGRGGRICRAATLEIAQVENYRRDLRVAVLRDDSLGSRSPQKLDDFPEGNGQDDDRGEPNEESGVVPRATHRGEEQYPPHASPPQTGVTQAFLPHVTPTPAPDGISPANAFPLSLAEIEAGHPRIGQSALRKEKPVDQLLVEASQAGASTVTHIHELALLHQNRVEVSTGGNTSHFSPHQGNLKGSIPSPRPPLAPTERAWSELKRDGLPAEGTLEHVGSLRLPVVEHLLVPDGRQQEINHQRQTEQAPIEARASGLGRTSGSRNQPQTSSPLERSNQSIVDAPLAGVLEPAGAAGPAVQADPTIPAVHVTIGRIEVRAAPSPPLPSKPGRHGPALSLDDYLKQRRGGGR